VTTKSSFKPRLELTAYAKTKVNTKLRFKTKINLNNPVFKPDLRNTSRQAFLLKPYSLDLV